MLWRCRWQWRLATGELLAPAPAAVVVAAVAVAGLVVPFAVFDLLAAVSCGYLAQVWFLAWQLADQPAGSLRTAGVTAMVACSILVIAGVILAARAPVVSDEDVRPSYARNIAERLTLRAEVTMGEEARRRMLPRQAPEVPGVALRFTAGGSDGYCDFFPLPDGRLGIAVAALGREGSAAALVMTLLKGYLSNYSSRFLSPEEVVRRVARRLGVDADRPVVLLYAVYDPGRRLLRFSRVGDEALVLAAGPDSALTPAPVAPAEPGELRLEPGAAGPPADAGATAVEWLRRESAIEAGTLDRASSPGDAEQGWLRWRSQADATARLEVAVKVSGAAVTDLVIDVQWAADGAEVDRPQARVLRIIRVIVVILVVIAACAVLIGAVVRRAVPWISAGVLLLLLAVGNGVDLVIDPPSLHEPMLWLGSVIGIARKRTGGLGMRLMKALMDEVHYELEPGTRNELRMVKKLRPE